MALLAVDLFALPFEVAGVFRLHLDLQPDLLREPLVARAIRRSRPRRGRRDTRRKIVIRKFRPAQQIDGVRLARQRLSQLGEQRRVDRAGCTTAASAAQFSLATASRLRSKKFQRASSTKPKLAPSLR